MKQSEALYQAIVDHPTDDLPRLAFADWLEEQGDEASVARARYIRGEVASAALLPEDPRRAEWQRQGDQLLARFGGQWQEGLDRLGETPFQYRRGFVAGFQM